MKYLSERRTWGLWDRLEREASQYYQTLHELKHELKIVGPIREVAQSFSDLERQHRRLKSRFKVMFLIGLPWFVPGSGRRISDLTVDCSNQVIGFGVIQAELQKESHNVRSR